MTAKSRSNGAQAHQHQPGAASPAPDSPAVSANPDDRRQLFASFFEQLYLEKDIFTHEDSILVRWPRKLEAPADYNIRLQLSNGRIYAEAEGKEGDCGDRVLAQAVSIPDGEYELILMPSASEYYVRGVRIQRKIPLSSVRSDYRTEPYGTYVERQVELLRYAISRDDGLYSEIAKMTLAWWNRISARKFLAAVDAVASFQEDHLSGLLGLLGIVCRHAENSEFPTEFRQPLDDCIISFPYCRQDYGEKSGNALSETDKLLLASCELLAGQLYPDRPFQCSQQLGQWHRQRAEDAVVRWLRRAATVGFSESSSRDLAQLLTALPYLIDLADSEKIWDLAAALIDKVLATVALDSFQGVYGAGQCAADRGAAVRSGYVSPLAGVARLKWGIGAWNWHLAAPLSLCCGQNYQQPQLIASLATDPAADGMWASERHAFAPGSDEEPQHSEDLHKQTLHKAVYRTPDYLLSSAQDFQAGQRGGGGQSWQATLSANAIVFVNHPASDDTSGDPTQNSHGSDYWRSGILPRVAQRRDLLIALYDLPETDLIGFTRAYFPTFAFDEHQVANHWAFAARGDAYIALGCSAPIALVQHGPVASSELRAAGRSVAWLCQMGRKADYDSFANFRKRVLASRLALDGLSVTYRQLQGDTVTFDWNGPLCVNGEPQPLQNANHYEGPNCVTDGWPASQMIVVHGDQALQLDLASGQ